jgi:predicted NBD/HSP70 family sugar kinase
LGVDAINAVAVDPYGRVLAQTQQSGGYPKIGDALKCLDLMVTRLRSAPAMRGRSLLGMGVGVPGPVDVTRGLLLYAPNRGWKNIPLLSMILEQTPHPPRVFVDNDANLAVFAEYMFGAHKHSSDLMYLYLNNGIGGGLILEHQLYRGRHGFAGEVGHMSIVPNGPKCSCGNRGCAETLFSWSALRAKLEVETKRKIDVNAVVRALEDGDEVVSRSVTQAGTYLGIFLSNLANAFDPKLLIIGGPMSALGDWLLAPALKEMHKRMFGDEFRQVSLEVCAYNGSASAIGAAGYAFHALMQNKTDDLPKLEECVEGGEQRAEGRKQRAKSEA